MYSLVQTALAVKEQVAGGVAAGARDEAPVGRRRRADRDVWYTMGMTAANEPPLRPPGHAVVATAVPDVVYELVERFQRNLTQYRATTYNETQVRREFLDPFFEALGWDVNNRQGYAEAYKDVVHEDAIRIAGKHKAPDYSFRIGGTRKFFVEAKKPAVDLGRDPQPALQVRRYAWSAKLPLSILTDFEELAVYDCRIQPEPSDRASAARTMLVPFTEYTSRWSELYGRFSREAVLRGSFDDYTDSAAKKRGTAEVDAVFLKDLQAWRQELARNIALRNKGITPRELNFAVQQILDRLVFLRICEDRLIEEYGRLRTAAAGKGAYAQLMRLFSIAEDRYNSGLFHFKAEKGRTSQVDAVTPGLTIDDKVLRDIIRHLYYPDSPYEFSVFSGEILGQVYEQFLGQVIRLTPAGRAEVEDKPAVRKAGGVFYTPTFIVAYIVARTIGRLLEGKTPKDVALLRFLDPACGSGSFLIAVFQYILDWHLAYYIKDGPEKHARGRPPRVYQTAGGAWRLTGDEKKRILLNNIYGVDIDAQAVEVTKLSLVLKVLEGETEESLGSQLGLFHERVLPDLGNNIKCGNSLVSPQDFYATHQPSLLGEEELYRVNPFDWRAEFPQVFAGADPGFDVVLGNPPYIRIQTMKEWAPAEVEFYKQRYASASKGNYDIYVVFVERGLELLNSRGLLGYILPHKFFNAQYGEPLRQLIADGRHLSEVIHFGHQQVFEQATTYTTLLFLHKGGEDQFRYVQVDDLSDWRSLREGREAYLVAGKATSSDWNFAVGDDARLYDALSSFPVTLADVAQRIGQGIRTSANDVFVVDVRGMLNGLCVAYSTFLNTEIQIEPDLLLHFLQGRAIKAYHILPSDKHVLVPYRLAGSSMRLIEEDQLRSSYPATYDYLLACRIRLEQREDGKMNRVDWYGYVYPKNLEVMMSPKIIAPDIADRAAFAYDVRGDFAFTSGYGITLRPDVRESPWYILAVLNSRLLTLYLKHVSTPLRGGFFRYFAQFVGQLPIRRINFSDSADVSRHERLAEGAQRLTDLHQQAGKSRTAHASDLLARQIRAETDAIDQLVAELYQLSDADTQLLTTSNG